MTTLLCIRCGHKISVTAARWRDEASDAGWIIEGVTGRVYCRECSEVKFR